MQLYHSTDRNGISLVRPSSAAMRALLQQLIDEHTDDDYPEVCLMNDSLGWTILVYPSAIVSLEIDKNPDDILYMQLKHCTDALQLWELLAEGNTQSLLQYPWRTSE